MSAQRLYAEKETVGWEITTRNYFIGRVPDMDKFLTWIEERGDKDITMEDIRRLNPANTFMVNFDIVELRSSFGCT